VVNELDGPGHIAMLASVWDSGFAIATWFMVAFIWGVGILCAVISFRKRHMLWFILGFFFVVCWYIGALLPDRRKVVVVEERR